jgi:hypothetical protein
LAPIWEVRVLSRRADEQLMLRADVTITLENSEGGGQSTTAAAAGAAVIAVAARAMAERTVAGRALRRVVLVGIGSLSGGTEVQ